MLLYSFAPLGISLMVHYERITVQLRHIKQLGMSHGTLQIFVNGLVSAANRVPTHTHLVH
jgi:hypothetical protein